MYLVYRRADGSSDGSPTTMPSPECPQMLVRAKYVVSGSKVIEEWCTSGTGMLAADKAANVEILLAAVDTASNGFK